METLLFKQFNHECSGLHESLNISEKRADELIALNVYYHHYTSWLKKKLFDKDDKNIPNDLIKKSGVLEKVLLECTDTNEIIFASLNYGKFSAMYDIEDPRFLVCTMMFHIKLEEISYDKEKFISWMAEEKESLF